MNPDSWERLAELFERLQELPEEEHESFLATHCSEDPSLADELRSMLRHSQAQESGFLKNPFPQPPPVNKNREGSVLGDFVLGRKIGSGGMGDVYQAEQKPFGRPVAVKILHSLTSDLSSAERFRREAQAAMRLNHPNIVSIISYQVEDGDAYYAMQLIKGQSLADYLNDVRKDPNAAWTSREAADRVAKIADALDHAHQNGVIHRDVKPANILIGQEGTPYLADFGIARDERNETITDAGQIPGTVRYMSPEQARILQLNVDHRTDVYSLGAVLYEILAGVPAIPGTETAEILANLQRNEPPLVRKHRPGIPSTLTEICWKALRRDPDDRYGSAAEMAADLRAFVAGGTVSFRFRRLSSGAHRACRKYSLPALATTALLFAAYQFMESKSATAFASMVEIETPPGVKETYWQPCRTVPGLLDPPEKLAFDGNTSQQRVIDSHFARLTLVDQEGTLRELLRWIEPGERLSLPPVTSQRMPLPMSKIPAGSLQLSYFAMSNGAPDKMSQEVPYSGFSIMRHPVTNRQFFRFLESADPELLATWKPWDGNEPESQDWWERPATGMSWQSAQDFAESFGMRLPTLVEWQVAMGAGQVNWNEEDFDQFVLDRPEVLEVNGVPSTRAAYLQFTEAAVTSGHGPHQMSHPVGNVMEWVASAVPYVHEPGRPPAWDRFQRYIVGTAWHYRRSHLPKDPARKLSFANASQASYDIGFRCAHSLDIPDSR